MAADLRRFLAPAAWVGGAWAHDVLLTVGADGCWSEVTPNAAPEASRGATKLAGPVLPGLVDAHSHAFQRAIAGLTERSEDGDEDFWSWRDRMYRVAHHVTPGQLEAIAAYLYAELLRAGYTHVCEFHYLHNDPQGRPYAEPGEMALALVRAAQRVGIGLTLLPTLYMRSGFGATGLREDQRRFGSTPDSVLRIARGNHEAGQARAAGSRPASRCIRCARSTRALLREAAAAAGADMPIHIHIAEQRREVEDCIALIRPRSGRVAVRAGRGGCALEHGACHALHAGRTGGAAQPPCLDRVVSQHRGQPGRWHLRSSVLARSERQLVDRLGQPCHAQLAGGTAAARIFAAPGPAPAQRRFARGLVREHGDCVVPGCAGRRERRLRGCRWAAWRMDSARTSWSWIPSRPRCLACLPTICSMHWCSPVPMPGLPRYSSPGARCWWAGGARFGAGHARGDAGSLALTGQSSRA